MKMSPKDVASQVQARHARSTMSMEVAELRALREDIQVLQKLLRRLIESKSIEQMIINGFAQITAQLEPLRNLEAIRNHGEQKGDPAVKGQRLAPGRPQWYGSDFTIYDESEHSDSAAGSDQGLSQDTLRP